MTARRRMLGTWPADYHGQCRADRGSHVLALRQLIDDTVAAGQHLPHGSIRRFLLERGVQHDMNVRAEFRTTFGASPRDYHTQKLVERAREIRATSPNIGSGFLALRLGANETQMARVLAELDGTGEEAA